MGLYGPPQPKELGYAQSTTDATIATGSAQADIAGVTTTVTVGSYPIEIRYSVSGCYNTVVGGVSTYYLLEDGVVIDEAWVTSSTANALYSFTRISRRSPSAGSHTYKMQFSSLGGSNVVHTNSGSNAAMPAFVQVVERAT